MFARERPSIRHDEIGGLAEIAPKRRDPLGRFKIEVRPRMDAPLPEVPVERAAVSVTIEQLTEFPQVRPQPLRRNGGVFPAFPCGRFAGNERGCPKGRLTNQPDLFDLVRVREDGSRPDGSAMREPSTE